MYAGNRSRLSPLAVRFFGEGRAFGCSSSSVIFMGCSIGASAIGAGIGNVLSALTYLRAWATISRITHSERILTNQTNGIGEYVYALSSVMPSVCCILSMLETIAVVDSNSTDR